MKRFARVALGVAAALTVAAAPAQAGIWTAVDSGTTDEISAVDYRTDALRYTTTTGKIIRRDPNGAVTQEASFPGRQFFDISFNPAGTLGLAAADTGMLFRYSGGGWAQVDLTNSSWDHTCPFSPAPAAAMTPTANLLAVAWGSDSVAWVVSDATGQVLKSTDGGATFTDASRQSDGTCRLNREITDVAPIPGTDQDVYFVDDYFAGLWRTSDGLQSTAQRRKELVNCYSIIFRVAVDPAAPNRVSVTGPCEGTLHWGFTSDGGTSSNYTDSRGAKLRDIAGQAGVFLAVGDAGQIEQSFDGTTVFAQPADGAFATKDWRATDFADASHAAIGGVGGALVLSDQANQMPDVVAPTVAIAGPDRALAGAAVTFTANAADNAGGVGIDPNGFQWSGNGVPATPGASVTVTFPSSGVYTVRVKARDLRGNISAEATKTVTVDQPSFLLGGNASANKPPLVGRAARIKGRYVTLRVKGKYGLPPGYTKAQACNGQMFISVVKKKRLLTARKTKLRSDCTYRKKIRIARKRVGKVKRLTLVVAFGGNQYLASISKKYRVKVKR